MAKPKRLKVVSNFSSVLIIRLNDIGEVVMTLPCLDAVRRALPGAKIGVLVSPPSHELLLQDERIDQIFVFEKKLWRGHPTMRAFKQLTTLLRDLRRQHFDVAIDLHNNPSTHWLSFVSGAKCRVSLESNHWSRRLLSWTVSPGAGWNKKHNVDRHFHILSAVGIPTSGAEYNFAPDIQARERVATSLQREIQPGKPLVVLQPGAGQPERCWPIQKFGELAERLSADLGAQIVVHCGPSEDHLGERIRQAVSQPVIIARRLTLQELAGLLSLCDLLVTNDSGPMHLGAALGIPIVAVFGPSDPQRSGPYKAQAEVVSRNLECSPCGIQNLACVQRECLTDISADQVYQAALRLLKQQQAQEDQEAASISAS
ncbi:MAG: glycosyltransferase family 9 protein [bacterium]